MEYAERVRLDRYAKKDPQKALDIGDLVVVSIKRYSEQKKRDVESREIGHVVKDNEDSTFDIRIDNDEKEVVTNVPRHRLEYVVEKTYADICDRIAGAVAEKDDEFKARISRLMAEEKFVPAGRILTGVGRSDFDFTLFNCYVYQIAEDSRGGIAKHWRRLFETYSRGGGVGWNLSILRPRGAVVKKVAGRSSGSVSWAEQFSQITGVVEQGGCFAAYEPIETTGGNILSVELASRIELGETIFALTHQGPKKITAAFRNGPKTIRSLEAKTSDGLVEIDITPDHRVVSKATGAPIPNLDGWNFVRAKNLRVGDEIGVLENGKVVPGVLVSYYDKMDLVDTYDFEVADAHLISCKGIYTSNSRRGAGLQGLEVWHPDIEEFIDVKAKRETIEAPDGQQISRNLNLLKNSNISVLITKNFMKAVERHEDWDLVFPDLNDPAYDDEWDGNLEAWKAAGRKVVVYKTVKARDLWDRIVHRAWESGEPGLIFLDRANEKSNSYYYDRIVCSNPCGEQLLPSSAICNLSHLNLANFIDAEDGELLPEQESTSTEASKKFNWDEFTQAIHDGIRFLDIVTDLNKYHDEDVEKKQIKERRVGLGILGYGEMLIHLGLRYGSEEAIKFTTNLMKHFSTQSYVASSNLAKEKGPFPKFDKEAFLKSGFMKTHTKAAKEAVTENGIRNVTVNTIAPTGSVAALMKTTGGCEPLIEIEYTSNTRIGVVEERPTIGQKIASKFGTDRSRWPSYVVTAMKGITPEQHVKTQAAMQRWIDASISKTTNLPADATPEDVATVYMEMWKSGCKGGTVYRDMSRDEQVLYVKKEEKEKETVDVELVQETPETAIIRPRPDVGQAQLFSEPSPVGTVHAGIRHDPEKGEPIDMFVNCGKGDLAADATAIGRLASMILRWANGAYVPQTTRLELIRDQLVDLLGRGQEGFGPSAKRSLPDAVAKIIDKYLSMEFPMPGIPFGTQPMESMFDRLEAAVKNGDMDEFNQIREHVFKGVAHADTPDSYRQEIEEEIKHAEATGSSIPYDYCSACGNYKLVIIPGKCPYCQHCGFTHC